MKVLLLAVLGSLYILFAMFLNNIFGAFLTFIFLIILALIVSLKIDIFTVNL